MTTLLRVYIFTLWSSIYLRLSETSSSTVIMADENPEDATSGRRYKRLRLPLDTRLYTTAEIP
ncbi:hypothetical protein PC119_g26866, partial [Phytophthora cactorum]